MRFRAVFRKYQPKPQVVWAYIGADNHDFGLIVKTGGNKSALITNQTAYGPSHSSYEMDCPLV